MEDDWAGEPVARQDEEVEEVAGIAAAAGNAAGALADCNKEASAAGSNTAAEDILAAAAHNRGIEGAMGGRTGPVAGKAAALVAAVALAVAVALVDAVALAVALAGPDGFEEADNPAPGRIRRPPR